MFERMRDDMDINCGDILSDQISVQEKGRYIYEMILRVASGEQTKSETQGLGDYEFVPWQIGAVMWGRALYIQKGAQEFRLSE